MSRQWRIGALLAVLLGVGAVLLAARITHVDTTSAAFVRREGSPLFERTSDGMRVLLEITPAQEPEAAGWIYRAAQWGIPVAVSVPYRGGRITFRVTGLTEAGDLIVPCKVEEECARILMANKFELPAELERYRNVSGP